MNTQSDFPRLLAMFFTKRLMQQRQASPHTIASYRDTFRLLVRYAQRKLNKSPSKLVLEDFDSTFLGAFLSHLENERGNNARTRNTRLAAIRSFFCYVALQEPCHAALAQRVLAIPDKRYTRRSVAFLNRDELDTLLQAPDRRTRLGRRDRTLLLVASQTGLRASELINLRCEDVHLGAGAHLRCQGKGRKERCTPLRKDAVAALRAWLQERRGEARDPVFPNQRGRSLSHDSLKYLLEKTSGHRTGPMPLFEEQTRHAALPSAHRRHGASPKWRRPVRDRVMARPRVRRDDLYLSARRSQTEGTGDGQNDAFAPAPAPIPAR